MRVFALLPVLLLSLGESLHGQAATDIPADYVPKDTEACWSVALARFQGAALSSENSYLTYSLPLLLQEKLAGVHTHYFRPEERRGYQAWILRQEQKRLGESLESLRRERDALFFQEMAELERREKLDLYDGKIDAAVERINVVRGMDPQAIDFPESKPICFTEPATARGGSTPAPGSGSSRDAGGLIEAPILSPLRVARDQGVNILIWGTLEEVQGYLYLEVRAVDAHLGREVFYHSDAAQAEQLYSSLEQTAADLSAVLWGRDWASLSVDTSPVGGEVYVDGVYAGRAPVQIEFLVPGPVELRVQAEGFRREILRVELAPYTVTRELVVLEEQPAEPVWVRSTPPGASIYDGSVWLGATPLAIQRPESLSRIVLRLEGYPEQVFYLGPESRPEVSVRFVIPDPSPAELQVRRRDAFYTAFGIFALSVPLPLFFWGATNDAYGAFLLANDPSNPLTYNPAEAVRLSGQVEGFYNTYLATLGVSGALLVNMVIHLIRYVRAADRRG